MEMPLIIHEIVAIKTRLDALEAELKKLMGPSREIPYPTPDPAPDHKRK